MINYFEVTPKILLPPLSAVTARPEPFFLHEHVTNTRSASLSDLAGLCSACSTLAQQCEPEGGWGMEPLVKRLEMCGLEDVSMPGVPVCLQHFLFRAR